jgi:hypothetical protein
MPRISSLPRDESLSGNETLVGTDTDTGESRKFILSDIKTYIDREANTAAVSDLTNIDVKNSIQLPTTTTNTGTPTDKGVISFGGDFSNGNRIFNDVSGGTLRIQASDNLDLQPANLRVHNSNGDLIQAGDTGVRLYHSNSEKFTTTSTGVTVKGALTIDTNKLVRFGQVTLSTASGSTAGGIFTQVFTVTGLTASSIVTATFNSSGNGRTIREVEPGTDSLTIRISNVADGAKISYIAIG